MMYSALLSLCCCIPLLDNPEPVVAAPSPELREAFQLTGFYAKWVDAFGLPIVASSRVHDEALLEARWLMVKMIGKRPDIFKSMADQKVRFTIMAFDEWTTDVPEHSSLYPARYWDRRARGLGATPHRPSVSCGEENLLAFPGDPYSTENILIHEFAHAIHQMGLNQVDPSFDGRLAASYQEAMTKGRWKSTYAATNRFEYWAEGVQSFFHTNRSDDDQHGPVDTPGELEEHDPPLFALCVEVFGANPWQFEKPSPSRPHLKTWNPKSAPTFAWPAPMNKSYQAHEQEKRAFEKAEGEDSLTFDRRAAGGGSLEALIRMGTRYRDGRGVEANDTTAVHWFQQAADKDYAPAQDHLGWMLSKGRGCEQNDVAAARLFRKAADQRFHQGRFNLALLLRDGRGFPGPDPVQAAMWFELAANARHEGASSALAKLRKTLSPEQAARASRLCLAWR